MVVEKAGLAALRSVAGEIRQAIGVVARAISSVENRRVLGLLTEVEDCLSNHLAEVETLADDEYGISVSRFPAQQKSCGANAKGGGGFQPGNDCAAASGGSGGGNGKKVASEAKDGAKVGAGDRYGGWQPAWRDNADAAEFIKNRNRSAFSPFLSPIEPGDLKEHKVFLSKDGNVGAAVSPEGDIQNVFNNGGPRGAATEALISAINGGGKTLDCYDGELPQRYAQLGFTETGRMKFNREYAPDGWGYERFGEPDVVFMAVTQKGTDDERRAKASGPRESRIGPKKSDRYYDGSEWDKAKSDSIAEADRGGNQGSDGAGGDGARAKSIDRTNGVAWRHLVIGKAKSSVVSASRSLLIRSQLKAAGGEGVWRTTDDGQKIFIGGDGEVRGGGPAGPVIVPAPAKKKRATAGKKTPDPSSPFVPKTKADQAIVDFIGDDRQLVESFKPFVDEAHNFLGEKYLQDRNSAMEVLSQFGFTGARASAFIGSLRFKSDHTRIRGFDEMAEYAMKYHPEMLAMETGESSGADDFEQALFNRLKRGFPNAPGKHSLEVMELAAEMAGPSFFDSAVQSDYDRELELEYADVDF